MKQRHIAPHLFYRLDSTALIGQYLGHMTPQKAFNHHLTQALAALRQCPPEFIAPAVKSARDALMNRRCESVADMFSTGALTGKMEQVFGLNAVVHARRKLGTVRMPMRYRSAPNPYPVDWLDELKKPGDVTTAPLRSASHRTSMNLMALSRGITIQTRTRGVAKGFVRITCLRNVETENKERMAAREVT